MKILRWSVLCALSANLIFAQGQTGGGTTGGTGGGAGAGSTGGSTGGTTATPGRTSPGVPNTNAPTTRQPSFDQLENRPIFLSGKVQMENGTPPPESVTIERVCPGRSSPVPEAYTDTKGHFQFQVGQRMGMLPDASVGNNDSVFGSPGGTSNTPGFGNGRNTVSERDLMGCELRATLPGYRSTIVSLAGRRSLDNPNVGTIILRRLGDVSGFTTSATSLMAPKEAKKSLEKGLNAVKKNKLADAQKEFEAAVGAHPKYAEAWFELGRIQSLQNNQEAARASYQKAIEADEKYINPYLGLASMEMGKQNWPVVKELSEKIIKMNRYDFPTAFLFGVVANYNLQDAEEAEKLCRAGIEIDGAHRLPKMSHLLGILLAGKQDFKGASEHLNTYLKFAPKANDIEFVKKQLAEIDGKIAQANK